MDTPSSVDPRADRDRFFEAIAAESSYHQLFNLMPGVTFFVKDRQSRLMAANEHFYRRFGFRTEDELVGKNDYELAPPRLAEHFRRDDAEVMSTGRPKLNIAELFFNTQGLPDWFITHKVPVFDRQHRVIGVMGTSQSYAEAKTVLQPYLAIDRAVSWVREHFREKITVAQLADHVHLSERQLHRRFIETFGISPQAFILKVRLQAACELLQRGDHRVNEVAREAGFSDQSAFGLRFRQHMGITPLAYQAQFRLVTQPAPKLP
jgi:PAS domain S-box-containing protein